MPSVPRPMRTMVEAGRRRLRRTRRVVGLVGGSTADGRHHDVWDWVGPKYRARALLLLLLNATLFAGLCCFTFWLRTGDYTPFGLDDYWELWWAAFDPVREPQVTLIDFLLYPIPLDQVPMMMVIMGLVLASLTAIPILISMLYRFPFSLIFTAIIAFVAMIPWLAITVTLCCYLARLRPLQFSFRYATALVSCLPLVAYYVLATRNASSAYVPTVEMARFYLPWVLALIGACAVIGVVLLIARLVNYRPGAITPLLAVMFAVPVGLFEVKVGHDELEYRLLEERFGPGSKTHFVDHLDEQATAAVFRAAARARIRQSDDQDLSLRSVMEQMRIALQLRVAAGQTGLDEIMHVLSESFVAQRGHAIDACRAFQSWYPDSRYIPNVLYLQGRATDMRMTPKCALFRGTLVVSHYQDFPSSASREVWEALHLRAPDNPLASVAAYRLAILDTRVGQVDRALERLDDLIRRFGQTETSEPAEPEVPRWLDLLEKRPAASSLGVDPAVVVLEARKLRHLLAHNRSPEQNDLALQRLFRLDPRNPMYRRHLEQLKADIERGDLISGLQDNLEVLIATLEPSHTLKIERLRQILERYADDADSDALPRAWFELGRAYQEDSLLAEARTTYRELLERYGDSPWALEAQRRLADMGVVGSGG